MTEDKKKQSPEPTTIANKAGDFVLGGLGLSPRDIGRRLGVNDLIKITSFYSRLKKDISRIKNADYRKEDWPQVQKRYKLTAEKISVLRRRFFWEAVLAFCFFLMGVWLDTVYLLKQDWYSLFAAGSYTFVTFSMLARALFRRAQLTHREMFPFHKWLFLPTLWL